MNCVSELVQVVKCLVVVDALVDAVDSVVVRWSGHEGVVGRQVAPRISTVFSVRLL